MKYALTYCSVMLSKKMYNHSLLAGVDESVVLTMAYSELWRWLSYSPWTRLLLWHCCVNSRTVEKNYNLVTHWMHSYVPLYMEFWARPNGKFNCPVLLFLWPNIKIGFENCLIKWRCLGWASAFVGCAIQTVMKRILKSFTDRRERRKNQMAPLAQSEL
jgi:hypothetical protein